MAKKKAARASAEPASPKRLRRKLEKLEARLASASDKRDRAQARVDALVILTDEVRASIAAAKEPANEPEVPAARAPVAPAQKASPPSKPTATRVAAQRPAATTRTRRTTRAPATRARRRPPTGGAGPASGSS